MIVIDSKKSSRSIKFVLLNMGIVFFPLVHMLWNLWIIFILSRTPKYMYITIYIWYAYGKICVCSAYKYDIRFSRSDLGLSRLCTQAASNGVF